LARNAAYRWRNQYDRCPITKAQRRYLAKLLRRLGEPLSTDGMTQAEARLAIDNAKARLGQ